MEILWNKLSHWLSRWALLVVLLWVALIGVAWYFSPSLTSVAAQQKAASLPNTAPSVQASELYRTKFTSGQQAANTESDLIVLADPQGISYKDISLAQQIVSWLHAPATHPAALLNIQGPDFASTDGKALRIVLTWSQTSGNLSTSIDKVNRYLKTQHLTQGRTLGLFGATPINQDLSTSSLSLGSGPGSLFGLLIIIIILGFVYRSILAVLLPLVTIGLALGLTIPLLAWLGHLFGLRVDTSSIEYIAFVLLGAGTNYGVFLLSRYREEIQRGTTYDRTGRRDALARAYGHVAEAIASSAATVIVATGVMGLAQLDLLHLVGPSVAVGVCCLLLAGLTVLPALMSLCGKALFWPIQPHPGTFAGNAPATRSIWKYAGESVIAHPRVIAFITTLMLLPLAISALTIMPSFDSLGILPDTAPSVQTFKIYQSHFKDAAQLQVLLNIPGTDLRQPQYRRSIDQVTTALTKVAHISLVRSPSTSLQKPADSSQYYATDGSVVALTLQLDVEASSPEALQTTNVILSTVSQVKQDTPLRQAQVLLKGETASIHDQGSLLTNDFLLIVSLVIGILYIILALLVRSLLAPIYLLGTIALSAGTAIGLTNLIFHDMLGKPLYYIIPIMSFVFLVALGEDFNILMMSRIREEVQLHGERQGIRDAVALTGGVLSSCGLVMAASFLRMATAPFVLLGELGFALVTGVLLDTFIVRPLLLPAIVLLLGRWNWLWFGKNALSTSTTYVNEEKMLSSKEV